jgi:hypothetical protein
VFNDFRRAGFLVNGMEVMEKSSTFSLRQKIAEIIDPQCWQLGQTMTDNIAFRRNYSLDRALMILDLIDSKLIDSNSKLIGLAERLEGCHPLELGQTLLEIAAELREISAAGQNTEQNKSK